MSLPTLHRPYATVQVFSNGLPAAQDHVEHFKAEMRYDTPGCSPQFSTGICKVNMPKDEIDKGRNAIGRRAETLARIEETGATFLITDLDLAMTLTRIAGNSAEDSEKRNRNRANARRAYDSVSKSMNTP